MEINEIQRKFLTFSQVPPLLHTAAKNWVVAKLQAQAHTR